VDDEPAHGNDDGVLVVPLDEDGNVLLAVEHSAALNRDAVVLAGGKVEPDEPLELTADRELQEELGWHADELTYLGELHPFKYLTSRQFVFLARGPTPRRRAGDERYAIGVRRVLLASFTSLCRRRTARRAHDRRVVPGPAVPGRASRTYGHAQGAAAAVGKPV
jgi:8-oxo-dGTP pyrophosphatase MutT (NUDIX family)